MMPHSSKNSPKTANGFTLVELLVSITILVILATITLYGMASVQTMAMNQRAKSQVLRIHQLIMERWESYETRSVATVPPIRFQNYPFGIGNADNRPSAEDMRLLGIRELMRFELPDRITDIYPPEDDPVFNDELVALPTLPALAKYYRRVTPAPPWGSLPNSTPKWSVENESAECLYLIISRMTIGDANALEFFGEDEIDDTDNDGVPEIVDPWGNPISFIRWPAGYSTTASYSLNEIPDPTNRDLTSDPYDLSLRELLSIRNPTDNPGRIPHSMIPLIISAGPDGQRAIPSEQTTSSNLADRVRYSVTPPVQRRQIPSDTPDDVFWPNDPFAFFGPSDDPFQIGQVISSELAADNITNHLISTGIK